MGKTFHKDSMLEHVEKYQASGQSIVSYCAKHDINPHNFYYWRKRFNTKRAEEAGRSEFVEIPIASTLSSPPVQLRTPQGYTLNFATLPPIDYLRQLLQC
jgi:transposase-like protein